MPSPKRQRLADEKGPSKIELLANCQKLSDGQMVSHASLQMFGGDVKVMDQNEELKPHRFTSGGTVSSLSPESDMSEVSPVFIRGGGMNSGGTLVHLPNAKNDPSPVEMNQITPKLIVTITPTLTPSISTSNLLANNANSNHFQFPPINSITAFNPLTLPPSNAAAAMISPGQATQIMHAGER
jgi:hypothetical protein